MTIKCKSFKARAGEMDEVINQYLAQNTVTDIVHVSAQAAPGSTLSYVTVFYREAEVKKTRVRTRSQQEQVKLDINKNVKPETNEHVKPEKKDVSNG